MKACLNHLQEKEHHGSEVLLTEPRVEGVNRSEARQAQNNFGERVTSRSIVVDAANWFAEAWEIPIAKSSLLVPTALARGPDICDTTTEACDR